MAFESQQSGNRAGFPTPGEMQAIVPRHAWTKIDFRFPPGLDAVELLEKLRSHLDRHGYGDIEIVTLHAGGYPWRSPYQSAMTQACVPARRAAYGKDPDGVGPSAPEGLFAHHFGFPAMTTGFGTPDCNIHAPNERLPVDQFIKGTKYALAIMHECSRA